MQEVLLLNPSVVYTSGTRYAQTFANTDLDGSGDITITHNLGYQYPQVTVINSSDIKVDGVRVTYDSLTALTLRVLGAGVFTGWRVEIL